ncbi:MAG TPA: hypothetical protein VL860_14560, partial [Planctomycetota bacterium]|nr:hypothetical protein [Planctomycetota bacterium]
MEIDGIHYRLAENREDIEGAMHLVYANYVDVAYCDRNWFEMYLYRFDLLPETRTMVAVRHNEVLGTLTLVFDSNFGIPSDHLYRAELEKLRIADRRIVELSKLAVNRNLARQHFPVLNNLFRLAWLFSSAVRQMTDMCILIEPSHENFYH